MFSLVRHKKLYFWTHCANVKPVDWKLAEVKRMIYSILLCWLINTFLNTVLLLKITNKCLTWLNRLNFSHGEKSSLCSWLSLEETADMLVYLYYYQIMFWEQSMYYYSNQYLVHNAIVLQSNSIQSSVLFRNLWGRSTYSH